MSALITIEENKCEFAIITEQDFSTYCEYFLFESGLWVMMAA